MSDNRKKSWWKRSERGQVWDPRDWGVSGKSAGTVAGSAAKGAAAGATIGSFVPVVGPALGAGIGAGVGTVGGWLQGWANREEGRESRQNLEQIRNQYQQQTDLRSGQIMRQAQAAGQASGQQMGQAMARSGISGPMGPALAATQQQKYTDTALDRIANVNAQMNLDMANREMGEKGRLRQNEQVRQQQMTDAFGDLTTSIMGYMNNQEMMSQYGDYIETLQEAINQMPIQQLQQLPMTQQVPPYIGQTFQDQQTGVYGPY